LCFLNFFAMRLATALTSADLQALDAYSRQAPHYRERRRALAVLGHHRGQSLGQLATLFAVRYATIHDWLTRWQCHGLAGLAEGRRSGRPRKLVPEAEKK
jgi:transposase